MGYLPHRSQGGYCEYMADGTKALLLKKIFSEAEKVLQDYEDGHCTCVDDVVVKVVIQGRDDQLDRVEEEEHNQRREAEEGLWQGNQLGFMELCLLSIVLEIFVYTYQLHIYR